MVEQPVSSLLLEHPDMRRAVACTGASSVSVELGRVGAPSTKPLLLAGTAAWLNGVATQIKRRGRLQQPMALVERKGKWLNGVGKLLKDSAAYPEEFGLIVAQAHGRYRMNERPILSTARSSTDAVEISD